MEELGAVSIKLDESSRSKLSLLLNRNCSGERGEIHRLTNPDGTQRRVRIFRRGRQRHRRYCIDEVKAKQDTSNRSSS